MDVNFVDCESFDCFSDVPVIVRNVFTKEEIKNILNHIENCLDDKIEVSYCNEIDCNGIQVKKLISKEDFKIKVKESSIYRRDWHLYKEKGAFYKTPVCFKDWMDEYQRNERNDDLINKKPRSLSTHDAE